MVRVLLHTSYIGTLYRGVVYIEPYYRYSDTRTVQGVLERIVKMVFKKRCQVTCSSRTDARVHALASTFQIDIPNDVEVDTDEMTTELNEKLRQHKQSIRINDIEIVNNEQFSAFRNVLSRSYLYRIAIQKKSELNTHLLNHNEALFPNAFPIEEVDRCYFIKNKDFNVDRIRNVLPLFVGKHDFLTFMKYSKEEKTKNSCYSQRHMLSLLIEPSEPCVTTYNLPLCETYYQFYDIHFKARSFVYRQIRKMVAVLIAVGEGKLTKRDVYEMLTIPSRKNWDDMEKKHSLQMAPAHALYFTNIEYKPVEDMSLKPMEMNARAVRMKSFFLNNDAKSN